MSEQTVKPGPVDPKTDVLHADRGLGSEREATPVVQTGSLHGLALDHYDLLEVLGRGGCGVVYRAYDRKLQRQVALKQMACELSASLVAHERFIREARAAAAIRHENVVQIHAVADGVPAYIVMEYVPGVSLDRHIRDRGRLGVTQALRIASQVARGLAAAHERGLVHRDVKPANILVEWDGAEPRVKLTDFGIARAADDTSLTQNGTVVGTPMYMSPEQARGEPLDHRSDLYSLGSVLYEAVCGQTPFPEVSGLTVLYWVAEGTPRPIREAMPEIPEWLVAILARLQAVRPEDRFPSAREVADLLERLLAAKGQGDHLMPQITPPALPTRRRWSLVASLSAAVCLCLFVAVAWFASRPQTDGEAGRTLEAAAAGLASSARAESPDRFTNALGMQFVRVPAGESRLGGGAGRPGEVPINVPAEFFLGMYEVTVDEWERVLGPGTHPARFTRVGELREQVAGLSDEALRRLPVEGVSWDDCQTFLRELNRKTPEVGWIYRMPRSDEWEYACRGGPGLSPADLGADVFAGQPALMADPTRLNYQATGLRRPVVGGKFPPNRLGLYDMHGNVFELLDAGDGDIRWFAGGCWHSPAAHARAALRLTVQRNHRVSGIGLRVARVRNGPAERPTATAEGELIANELRQRNPLFKGEVTVRSEHGRVREIWIANLSDLTDLSPLRRHDALEVLGVTACQAADLSPLQGMPLRHLNLNGNVAVKDLSPLKGMPLEQLSIWGFQGDNLAPLAKMPLRYLNCGGGQGRLDLSPLRGMPLTGLVLNHTRVDGLAPLSKLPLVELSINHTLVQDLAPLTEMKTLRTLHIEGSPVTSLAPLRGLPIESIEVTYKPERDAELLRALPMLREINKKAANDFWASVGGK